MRVLVYGADPGPVAASIRESDSSADITIRSQYRGDEPADQVHVVGDFPLPAEAYPGMERIAHAEPLPPEAGRTIEDMSKADLQAYLTLNQIPFETDANKAALLKLAKGQ